MYSIFYTKKAIKGIQKLKTAKLDKIKIFNRLNKNRSLSIFTFI